MDRQGQACRAGEIVGAAEQLLAPSGPLRGKTVIVTAGPTREAIDPVRFVGNRSSGKMGYALASAARSRGAKRGADQRARPGFSRRQASK